MLLEEARDNTHVIGFVDELVTLLGWKKTALWESEGNLKFQKAPAGAVHTGSRGASTPAPAPDLAELPRAAEKPAKYRARKRPGARGPSSEPS
jgi:hypothetical protein